MLYLIAFGFGLGPVFQKAGQGSYLQFVAPGVIGMSVLFSSIFSGIGLLWDRQFGFLKETLVAPVPRLQIMAGKTFGGATVSMIQGLLVLVMCLIAGFRPAHASTLPLAALFMALIAIVFAALGIAIGSKLQNMQGFQLIMNFLVMPIFFLSGALFPLAGLPLGMVLATRIDPLTYGIDGLRGAFIGVSHFSVTTNAASSRLRRRNVHRARRARILEDSDLTWPDPGAFARTTRSCERRSGCSPIAASTPRAWTRSPSVSGVSKATIYKHWPDKEALCLEVLMHIHGHEAQPPEVDTGDLRTDLVTVLSHQPPGTARRGAATADAAPAGLRRAESGLRQGVASPRARAAPRAADRGARAGDCSRRAASRSPHRHCAGAARRPDGLRPHHDVDRQRKSPRASVN